MIIRIDILVGNDRQAKQYLEDLAHVTYSEYVMDAAGKEGSNLQMIPFPNGDYPVHPTFDLAG